MLVALVRPNYYTHLITPPLGIGYIAGYLRSHGVDCTVIDGLNRGLDTEALAAACEDADLVGISCLSDFLAETIDLTAALKARGKRVVIGGPHASALPKETVAETGADLVIVGEGEQTMAELVAYAEGGEQGTLPEGVCTGDEADFRPREFIADLESLPLPDWAQMDPRTYRHAPHGGLIKSFPVAPITTTRGCPFDCSFCASPTLWGRRIRFRSPEKVVDEIEYLVKDFGVREIHFEDDNFTLRADHAEGVCREILRREIRISWALPNGIRVDAVTPELLKLMHESGCYYTAFGVESGSPEILRNVNKRTDLDRIEQAVHWAHDVGIMTQGFFIFGLPGETAETIEETIEFAKRIPLDRGQFLLLDMLPGSRLWDELKDELRADSRSRSYQEAKWIPPTLDEETLRGAPARAFRRFFFRPKQMLKLLRFVRLSQLPFILQRVRDFGMFGRR